MLLAQEKECEIALRRFQHGKERRDAPHFEDDL